VSSSGVAVARLDRSATPPRLVHCSFTPLGDDVAAEAVVNGLSVERSLVTSVMAAGSYQMLLVEAPDVPEAELRAAIRWRIKELLDFHVDDAVIDVFTMPEQSRGGATRMMYAVAARADAVSEQAELAQGAGLSLDAIDIPELCMRNLTAQLAEDEYGVACLYVGERHGFLTLTRQGVIYLTRHVDVGVITLADADGLRSELIAGLALEIRRSLDYFESHYDQKPISSLYVAGLEPGDRNDLSIDLSVMVKPLDLRDLVACDEDIAPDVAWRVLPAVGAALRAEPVTL
jgi:MSHA biogenesis protein MshI